MLQIIGAIVRAFILSAIIIAPAYILPNIPNVARELSMIIAGIIAAFVLFEYGSKSPGFVDFRFAPPYNRFRVAILAALAIGLSLLGRAQISGNSEILALADQTIPITVSLNSPVDFALTRLSMVSTGATTEALTRMFSAGFFISASMSFGLAALLWIFKWPFGRKEFNLWANLPTFTPAEVSLTGRRLRRDGWLNILLSGVLFYAIPFLFPLLQSRLGPDLFGNMHSLVWVVTFWAFLPALMFVRGTSLIKISRILSRAIAAK